MNYKTRSDFIKEEIRKLCFKFSKTRDVDVQNCMRSLTGVSKNVPLIGIENSILTKLRNENVDESKIIDVGNNIRVLTNMNLEKYGKILYFLYYMSTINSEDNTQSWNTMNSMSIGKTNTQSDVRSTLSDSRNKTHNLRSHNYRISNILTEHDIIGDVLYMIMGVNGQYLEWNETRQVLDIKGNYEVSPNMYIPACKLVQCGVAFKFIKNYVDKGISSDSSGVVKQGFCAALNEYLKAYINMVANLQSKYSNWTLEIEKDKGNVVYNGENFLTLERLIYNLQEPSKILIFLVNVIDDAGDKKGGPLASEIYSHLLCGDPVREKLIRKLLLSAVEPLYEFIQKWIYDGIVEENQEFFIALNTETGNKCLWSEKYGIKDKFIPQFISNSQATKILQTGKSINFLREQCKEQISLKTDPKISKVMEVTAESMINQDIDRSFETLINTVYMVTSKKLLDVIFIKFNLNDHFTALRKFMLHGQGDFILRILELIGSHLSMASKYLHHSTLEATLFEAIRTTNAQFLSPNIQGRLGIEFKKFNEAEKGWDTFTLKYEFGDIRPLIVILNDKTHNYYTRAFFHLFRGRRVHFLLNNLFKKQSSYRKRFISLKEISPVFQLTYRIIHQQLHFINQIQYYVNFEVLESSWTRFMVDINKAENLDEVIIQHSSFLAQVTNRLMLEENVRDVLGHLRSIYDNIITFEEIHQQMVNEFTDEIRFREMYDAEVQALQSQGKWGITNNKEIEESKRRAQFKNRTVDSLVLKLKLQHSTFEKSVVTFLASLSKHKDPSLRCLLTNLDFNDYYGPLLKAQKQKELKNNQQTV